jgi:hypothetical protein
MYVTVEGIKVVLDGPDINCGMPFWVPANHVSIISPFPFIIPLMLRLDMKLTELLQKLREVIYVCKASVLYTSAARTCSRMSSEARTPSPHSGNPMRRATKSRCMLYFFFTS